MLESHCRASPGPRQGTFLVRGSTSVDGAFVLSHVKDEGGGVLHHIIYSVAGGVEFFGERFATLPALVKANAELNIANRYPPGRNPTRHREPP